MLFNQSIDPHKKLPGFTAWNPSHILLILFLNNIVFDFTTSIILWYLPVNNHVILPDLFWINRTLWRSRNIKYCYIASHCVGTIFVFSNELIYSSIWSYTFSDSYCCSVVLIHDRHLQAISEGLLSLCPGLSWRRLTINWDIEYKGFSCKYFYIHHSISINSWYRVLWSGSVWQRRIWWLRFSSFVDSLDSKLIYDAFNKTSYFSCRFLCFSPGTNFPSLIVSISSFNDVSSDSTSTIKFWPLPF